MASLARGVQQLRTGAAVRHCDGRAVTSGDPHRPIDRLSGRYRTSPATRASRQTIQSSSVRRPRPRAARRPPPRPVRRCTRGWARHEPTRADTCSDATMAGDSLANTGPPRSDVTGERWRQHVASVPCLHPARVESAVICELGTSTSGQLQAIARPRACSNTRIWGSRYHQSEVTNLGLDPPK